MGTLIAVMFPRTATAPRRLTTGRADAPPSTHAPHRSATLLSAVLMGLVLASCATNEAVEPDVPVLTEAGPAPSVFIEVQPPLREAVHAAALRHPLLRNSTVGDQPSAPVQYTVRLSFNSSVDRKRQVSNQSGAIIGGPVTMLLGAVMPWACATNHYLEVTVLGSDGTLLAHEHLQEKEERVGTMVWCPDVTEPGEGVAKKMADAVFGKLEQAGVFSSGGKR
jgi:hypothetical protein